MRFVVCAFFVLFVTLNICFAGQGTITLEGIFWEPTLDSEFRTNTATVSGTRLSPNDLNWDPTTETYGAGMRLSIFGLVIFRGSYHSLFFDGSVVLSQPVTIGDYIFSPGTTLSTSLLMERYGFSVLVPVIPVPYIRVNMGLFMGATRYILRATGVVLNPPGQKKTVTVDTFMPILSPEVEAVVRLPGIRWLYGVASLAYIAYNQEEQKLGRYLRIKVSVRLVPGPLFAFEAGLLAQSTDYEDKDPDEGFVYREVTTGFFAGIVFSF